MSFKNLIFLVAAVLALTVSPVYAASWTVSATGIITDGYGGGLFKTSYTIVGDSYTLTITTNPNLNSNKYSTNYTTGGSYFGDYGAIGTITATVKGISVTDIINPNINGTISAWNNYGNNS